MGKVKKIRGVPEKDHYRMAAEAINLGVKANRANTKVVRDAGMWWCERGGFLCVSVTDYLMIGVDEGKIKLKEAEGDG